MNDRSRPVPQARFARLAAFGQIAGGVATGMVGEGLRRLAKGERPQLSELILTPGNARKVTEQLSRLRGAAMKLGQMLSMDAGDVLPPELTSILAQLRDNAHIMPPPQLDRVLVEAWGSNWRRRFLRFDPTPIAAASIGQVHRATLPGGRELAIKVQYPGVAASIDADIDNVATLLRLSGLLPATLNIAPLLAEAKKQLHEEADYQREAAEMRHFKTLLGQDDRFLVPEPVDDLLRPTVLPMDFLSGRPIDKLADATQSERDRAVTALLDLVLRELFVFGHMQTDPNFANYRWQPETGRILLLDFGAARAVAPVTAEAYRLLLQAGLAGSADDIRNALLRIGFVSPTQLDRHGLAIEEMIGILLRHLERSRDSLFDFADRSFVAGLRERGAPILADRSTWTLPPADTLFIQRKISGTVLLSVRLRAKLPLIEMLTPFAKA
ncbi:ubiquinol-cytochrome C reductase [Niveispirillum lacus]|uniref:Ubiquinol-cytochrome C reductase n=1 Tax=Niveispirillum lacus TaxID=1981099 RepID=A0A255YZY4_9PROT|nr:AarF/ABC1/UbiB kinase family protein [Niveispirillum lacus]OYQ34244.1 ubiquinol-cytochrome C reductase [Niveispirillum lacus]